MQHFTLPWRWQGIHPAARHALILLLFGVLLAGSFVGGHVLGVFAHASCARGDHAYTVVRGDTLGGIATRYHTTWQRLASSNHIRNANLIYPDQRICISGSTRSSNAPIPTMINQIFGVDGPAAMRVARCESGFNPNAYNPISVGGSHAAGVFQILFPSTWRGTSLAAWSPYDARANILAAHQIFVRDGHSWREWACKP
jgi:LysM domain/Transglycosylase SLT domain